MTLRQIIETTTKGTSGFICATSAIISANIADIITTHKILQYENGIEANPIMNYLFDEFGETEGYAIKLAIVGGFILAVGLAQKYENEKKLKHSSKKTNNGTYGLYTGALITLVCPLNNLYQLCMNV